MMRSAWGTPSMVSAPGMSITQKIACAKTAAQNSLSPRVFLNLPIIVEKISLIEMTNPKPRL